MSKAYQAAKMAPAGLIKRAGLICGGRSFVVGSWYAPLKPGPAKKPRFLREFRRDGMAVYEVMNSTARRVTRVCAVSVWCRWAGEKVEL